MGVSFGAIGSTSKATFEAARNLAIGIGIQNFPEGLAVSLPLHASGFSLAKSFWYVTFMFYSQSLIIVIVSQVWSAVRNGRANLRSFR